MFPIAQTLRCVALLLATTTATFAANPAPPAPRDRAEAVAIVRDLTRIVTPTGIEETRTVRIGGIDQWISIRGMDRRNPVLLFLHGGPGFVAMPSAWYFSRGWEDYFTVVHWDQRGAGKTYAANGGAAIADTMTVQRMLDDTEALAALLRRELKRDKIFVAGHSWGSFLGLRLAAKRPEWLHAYIGLGQGIDIAESERRGYAFALAEARSAGNATAVRELEALAPYAATDEPLKLAAIGTQRRWLNEFGGAAYRRKDAARFEYRAGYLSPGYTDAELATRDEANEFSESQLLPAMLTQDLSDITKLDCPLVLLLGRHDYNVSATVAAEWFARVKAPAKSLVWFEHSAHEMMLEEPGKTLVSLVTLARPHAENAGDVAPQ